MCILNNVHKLSRYISFSIIYLEMEEYDELDESLIEMSNTESPRVHLFNLRGGGGGYGFFGGKHFCQQI